jgi:hypothetical protein
VNTRDPREPKDPRDPRDTRGRDTDYSGTRYSTTPEPRPDRSWLRWVIPAAIVALLFPLLFNRGHREPERTPAGATEQQNPTAARLASPTSVYFESGGANLTDADRQKIADVASSAKQSGAEVALTGSKDRADTVRQALISQGLPESRIEVKEPAAAGSDQQDRVDITLAEK